jgi:chorismate-pyruvate lyase
VTAVFDASGLRQALLRGPQTVTGFLEAITGERLVADVIRRDTEPAGRANDLAVATGRPVTVRTAVLRGSASGRRYVYAESTFVPERLPDSVRARLAETADPIGRVLVDHGLAPGREPVPGPRAPPAGLEPGLAGEIVFARAYRLVIEGAPVFAIREWFLRPVLDALGPSRAVPPDAVT